MPGAGFVYGVLYPPAHRDTDGAGVTAAAETLTEKGQQAGHQPGNLLLG